MSGRTDLRARLLLSVQRALFGEVTANMRAVTCSVAESKIALRWIIDGAISNELRETASEVGTEVVADFSGHQIADELVRCDSPSDIEILHLDHLAYLRKE